MTVNDDAGQDRPPATGAAPQQPPSKPSRTVPMVIATAFLMENIDSTALTTAIPVMAHDLGSDVVHMKLALTSYLMSLAVFIPASGWAADRFGAKRVFIAAIAVFTFASIACALAWSLPALVAARILQGIGGAMMSPVGRSVVILSTDKRDLIGALVWVSLPAMVGPILGPPLGGVMVTYATWHWVFLINVPIGILGMVLAQRLLPDLPTHETKFDTTGFLLVGGGLAMIVIASSLVAIGGRDISLALVGGLISALLLTLFVIHSRRTAKPILDVRLMSLESLQTSIVGGTFFRIGIGGMPFLLPLLFQVGFGLSPLTSGFLTLASGAGAIIMRPIAVGVVKRYGYKRVLLLNGLATSLTFALPATFSPAWPVVLIAAVLFVTGTLRALQFTALGAFAMADVDGKDTSAASTLQAVAQQLAASLGVSAAAAVLQLTRAQPDGAIELSSFSLAFCIVSLLSSISLYWYWRLPATAGYQLIRR